MERKKFSKKSDCKYITNAMGIVRIVAVSLMLRICRLTTFNRFFGTMGQTKWITFCLLAEVAITTKEPRP